MCLCKEKSTFQQVFSISNFFLNLEMTRADMTFLLIQFQTDVKMLLLIIDIYISLGGNFELPSYFHTPKLWIFVLRETQNTQCRKLICEYFNDKCTFLNLIEKWCNLIKQKLNLMWFCNCLRKKQNMFVSHKNTFLIYVILHRFT
jgi:hypothetical protein